MIREGRKMGNSSVMIRGKKEKIAPDEEGVRLSRKKIKTIYHPFS